MMQRLIEFLLSVRPSSWTTGGQWRVQWLNVPQHDRALLLAAGIGIVIWVVAAVYRREGRGMHRLTWWSLMGLRLLLLSGVLVMLLEPVLVFRKTEYAPSNLIVLTDASTSMDLHDAYLDAGKANAIVAAMKLSGPSDLQLRSRGELADRALAGDVLDKLGARGDRIVRRLDFGARLLPTPGKSTTRPTTGTSTQPGGDPATLVDRSGTAIGASLRQALGAYAGQPIAGVLVVSDGQNNTGELPVKAAEFAAAAGVPVAALVVGTAEGPRSARIDKVDVSPIVFVRDPNPVHVLVSSRGMAGQPATVVLERSRNGGDWEEVGRQAVTLGEAGQVRTADFEVKEDRPVALQLRARLEDAGPELKADDHAQVADVRAINQKIKVLFIAGETFPEVEFVRAMLLRDKGLSADTWIQTADAGYEQPGSPPIKRLPETAEELNAYDCVILYDPDPNLWPNNYAEMLNNFVAKEGGGVVYVAGERNTKNLYDRPDDPSLSWLNLLPVMVEPGLYHSDATVRLSSQNAWKLDVTAEGKANPIFQFSDKPDENDAVLRSLPGMYWHFPVSRAKPGATVLAVHGDPRMRNEHGQHVLLATQLVGPGRSFFVAFDSTYRWRFLDDKFFDSFWAHLVDMAGRSKQLGGRYPYVLSTDRTEYRPGSRVTLTAKFDNPTDRDAGLDSLHGEVQVGEDAPMELTLSPRPGDPTAFEAAFPADKAGTHHVRVWAGGPDAKGLVRAATLDVPVTVPDLEFENPVVDPATLSAMARAANGKVFDLATASQIPEAFKTGRVAHVLEDRQEIWDAPLVYGTVLVALVLEWVLRKKVQLV